MSSLEKIKSMTEALEKAKATLKAGARENLINAMAEVFVIHPDLESIKWQQYTPYFNDGEPCEFRVGELYLKLNGFPEDAGDYEDGYAGKYDIKYYTDDYSQKLSYENKNENHKHKIIFDELMPIHNNEELLEAAFGDHVEITISRDGTCTVEKYEHD